MKKRTAFEFVSTTRILKPNSERRRFFASTTTSTATTGTTTARNNSKSVTGTVYTATCTPEEEDDNNNNNNNIGNITICLYTKRDCTLCDQVKDVLYSIRTTHPHSLMQIDITDDMEHCSTTTTGDTSWWNKYKYDIPVLHLNGQYWCKHKLSVPQAQQALEAYRAGTWKGPPPGEEPNAAKSHGTSSFQTKMNEKKK
jgi:Glutaredoxin-like domain (DUF836)